MQNKQMNVSENKTHLDNKLLVESSDNLFKSKFKEISVSEIVNYDDETEEIQAQCQSEQDKSIGLTTEMSSNDDYQHYRMLLKLDKNIISLTSEVMSLKNQLANTNMTNCDEIHKKLSKLDSSIDILLTNYNKSSVLLSRCDAAVGNTQHMLTKVNEIHKHISDQLSSHDVKIFIMLESIQNQLKNMHIK